MVKKTQVHVQKNSYIYFILFENSLYDGVKRQVFKLQNHNKYCIIFEKHVFEQNLDGNLTFFSRKKKQLFWWKFFTFLKKSISRIVEMIFENFLKSIIKKRLIFLEKKLKGDGRKIKQSAF